VYKIGQIVDVVGNGSIHKGMPHKYYHGKTGVVWNVTPRALGVEINKLHRNRVIRKRIHVRLEHVKPSKSRNDFLTRVKENEKKRADAKEKGAKKAVLKRVPVQPRGGGFVSGKNVVTLYPLPYAGIPV
jgi:large subunit ribosomal protein L21e